MKLGLDVSALYDYNKNFSGNAFLKTLRLRYLLAILICNLTIDAQAQTLIMTLSDLRNITKNLAGAYILGADIDASATANGGFTPIGSMKTPFTGVLLGNGHVIKNLTVTSTAAEVGLFGHIGAAALIQSVGLTSVNITAQTTSYSPVGALAGTNEGTVSRCYVTGRVTGSDNLDDPTGGLIGTNKGTVISSYADATVAGADSGGLVGDNFGQIEGSFAGGAVTGGAGGYRAAGGFVGGNYGSITTSYSTAAVTGTYGRVGGFVGFNENGSIADASAAGTVSGLGTLGTSQFFVGGLIGENGGTVTASLSTGTVAGSSSYAIGGLIGQSDSGSTTTRSYWDDQASGQKKSKGGTGATTAQLKAKLPTGFSGSIWGIAAGSSYPYILEK